MARRLRGCGHPSERVPKPADLPIAYTPSLPARFLLLLHLGHQVGPHLAARVVHSVIHPLLPPNGQAFRSILLTWLRPRATKHLDIIHWQPRDLNVGSSLTRYIIEKAGHFIWLNQES